MNEPSRWTYRHYLRIRHICPHHGCSYSSPRAQKGNLEGFLLVLSMTPYSARWALGPVYLCCSIFGSVWPSHTPAASTPPSRLRDSSLLCTRCPIALGASPPLALCSDQGHQPAAQSLELWEKKDEASALCKNTSFPEKGAPNTEFF